jgi:hypothetical protein
MKPHKWTLAAGHVHLFHIVAPIIARERNYFRDEGAGECDFLHSGSDAKTLEGMKEGVYQIGLDPKPYLVCEAQRSGADFFIVGGCVLRAKFFAAPDLTPTAWSHGSSMARVRAASSNPPSIQVRSTRR